MLRVNDLSLDDPSNRRKILIQEWECQGGVISSKTQEMFAIAELMQTNRSARSSDSNCQLPCEGFCLNLATAVHTLARHCDAWDDLARYFKFDKEWIAQTGCKKGFMGMKLATVINAWLTETKNPSWETLATAMASDQVGLPHMYYSIMESCLA